MKRYVAWSLLLFLLVAGRLFGQAPGNIVGTVVDPSGDLVAGAKVTVINEGTQFTRVTTTNAAGQYAADSFPTGSITVSVEKPGFEKLVRSGMQLTAADTITVNLQLAVGSVQQSVSVNAEAPLVQSRPPRCLRL
jgi:hypothetical protein